MGDIQGIIASAIMYLLKPFINFLTNNTYSITELVFNLKKDGSGSNGLVYGIFTTGEVQNIIKVGMNGVMLACYMFLALGILHYAYLITRSGSNDRIRAELFGNTVAFFFAGFMINNIETIYDMMFQLNRAIVNTFAKMVGTVSFQDHDGGDELVTMVLLLMFVGLSLWANFYYLMRKFIIMILMITGPIFIIVSVFPQFRPVTGTWARELFSNIISQSIHAIMLWIFLMMAATDSTDWLLQVVFLATFIPVSEMIKSLMGVSSTSGGLAGASSIAAIGAAASAAGGVKNFVGGAGSSVMDKMRSSFGGGGNANGSSNAAFAGYSPPGAMGNATNSMIGSGGMANGMPISPLTPAPVTPNRRANRMLAAGNFAGRAASSLGAVAGGIMGAPLGAYGMMMGSSLGANAGSTVGTIGGRALGQGMNLATKEAGSIYQGASQVFQQAQGESVLSKMGAVSKGGFQGSFVGKAITGTQQAANTASVAFQTGGMNGVGQTLSRSIGQNAENIKRSMRDTGATTMGILQGASGYNNAYQLLENSSPLNQAVDNSTVSMSELSQMAKNGEIKRLREVQTNEGTFIVGRKLGSDGKMSPPIRLSKVGEANPLLKQGESIVRNMQFNNDQIEYTNGPQIRGENGVNIDAQNMYQKVNPQTLFKSPHTNLVRKRAEREHLQNWISQKGVGGKA